MVNQNGLPRNQPFSINLRIIIHPSNKFLRHEYPDFQAWFKSIYLVPEPLLPSIDCEQLFKTEKNQPLPQQQL